VDRYRVKEARRLVLLSCPPDSRVLDEILALSKAEEVILAFSPEEIVDNKVVVRWIMKYIKSVVNNKGGHTSVQDLAAFTAQTELAVMEMLRFLEQQGMLEVKIGEYGKLHIKLNAQKVPKAKLPPPLTALMNETSAYRRHMNTHAKTGTGTRYS
jgi:hypothetical protein